MEIVFLPVWANICIVAAVLGLVGFSFGPKLADKITVVSARAVYYITAMSIVVALGAIFALLSGVSVTGGVLASYAVISGIGLVAAGFSCMGAESPKYVPAIGGIVTVAIVFTTLAFANIAFAAIWLAVLAVLLFIGRTLFKTK